MTLPVRAWMLGLLLLIALTGGCGLTPKNFRQISDPAPLVRARAVGLGEGLPTGEVIPNLIQHLDDADPVVRMAAFEELRKRTGQTFDYLPWASEADRARSVQLWRRWWQSRSTPSNTATTPRR